jgi:hypothetical protein
VPEPQQQKKQQEVKEMLKTNSESEEELIVEVRKGSAETPAAHDSVVPHTTVAGGQDTRAPQRLGDDPTTSVGAGNTDSGDDGHQPVNDDRSESSESNIETEESEGSETSDDPSGPVSDSDEEPEDDQDKPRRSSRNRQPPQWQASGEFVMACQPNHNDRPQSIKLKTLVELLNSGRLLNRSLAHVVEDMSFSSGGNM